MEIRLVNTEAEFDALESAWNRLADKTSASIFSSFDYVRTAWKHFHAPSDRLFIIVISNGAFVAGIAPFFINLRRRMGIPHRVIRFIASWEGDRPQILSEGNEKKTWNQIIEFLHNEFKAWDILDLIEQPVEGPEGGGWAFLNRPGWYWEKKGSGTDYYIDIDGSWVEYLKSVGSDTRRNYRRASKRLASLPGGYVVEQISKPGEMKQALSRFVAIERAGWKAHAHIGAAKDENHQVFYEDLLVRLAEKGKAMIFLLQSGRADIAGFIQFEQYGVSYGRHTAYLPAYKAYSPGIFLHAEIARRLFESGSREFDLLTLKGENGSQKHKTSWTNRRRETVQWTGFRINSRLLPLILLKKYKRILKKTLRQF
jgi:CelD/BcsL family acetyltransferase involved in cellulose biosynthesis